MFLKLVQRKMLMPLLLIASLLLIAARPLQEPSGVSVLVQLAYAAFIALVGWPMLLAVIVTALQYWNILGPSGAETFTFWANVVVFAGIFILAILGKLDLVNSIDATFGTLAKVLADVLILLGVPYGFLQSRKHTEGLRTTYMFQRSLAKK